MLFSREFFISKTVLVFFLVFNATRSLGQEPCTRIGCESGVSIELEKSSSWKKGVYRFEFKLDDKKIICSGSLPLKPCEWPSVQCKSDGPQYQDLPISIGESGCALPKDQHSFGPIMIRSTPQKLALQIFFQNKLLGKIESVPVYKTVYPNGEKCGPKCTQAQLNLKF
jgi:hypothetical protein